MFCRVSFCHCNVWPFSIYGFRLPRWYIQSIWMQSAAHGVHSDTFMWRISVIWYLRASVPILNSYDSLQRVIQTFPIDTSHPVCKYIKNTNSKRKKCGLILSTKIWHFERWRYIIGQKYVKYILCYFFLFKCISVKNCTLDIVGKGTLEQRLNPGITF